VGNVSEGRGLQKEGEIQSKLRAAGGAPDKLSLPEHEHDSGMLGERHLSKKDISEKLKKGAKKRTLWHIHPRLLKGSNKKAVRKAPRVKEGVIATYRELRCDLGP